MRPLNATRCLATSGAALLLTGAATSAQLIHYVDRNAVGANDGTSWADAYTDLQDGLFVLYAGDEIRVADGVYKPDGESLDRTASFSLQPGMTVRGGFAGWGAPDPDLQDPIASPTVLDGDLLGDDGPDFANRDDNSRHVVVVSTGATPTTLQGVFVRGGHADGSDGSTLNGAGIGIYGTGEAALEEVYVYDNLSGLAAPGPDVNASGAGIYVASNSASTTISDSLLYRNQIRHTVATPLVGIFGAGLRSNGDITITDTAFQENQLLVTSGVPGLGRGAGATLYALNSVVTLERCTFRANVARVPSGAGVGLYVEASGDTTGSVVGCDFIANSSTATGGNGPSGGGADLFGPFDVVGCRFLGNRLNGGSGLGGGLQAFHPDVVVSACLFSGNATDGNGGAVYGYAGEFTNLTIVGNTAAGLSGGAFSGPDAHWTNSILWGNTDGNGSDQSAQIRGFGPGDGDIDHSCVQSWTGSLGGVGNSGADPLLVDADGPDDVAGTEDDQVDLAPGSPSIDAGDDASVAADGADLDCDGDVAEPAPLDAAGNVRFVDDPLAPDGVATVDRGAYESGGTPPVDAWTDLGSALAGLLGEPQLSGSGTLCGGDPFAVVLTDARPFATAALVLGLTVANLPFKGGVLVPAPDVIVSGLSTGTGTFTIGGTWSSAAPSGFALVWQVWIVDAAGPFGFAASNAVVGVTP